MGWLQKMTQWANGKVLHLCESTAGVPFCSSQRLQRSLCPMSWLHLIYNHRMVVISSYKESGMSNCFDLPLHILKPLWQRIGSLALLACASLGSCFGLVWVGFFWSVQMQITGCQHLKHKCHPPFMSLGKQRLNSVYHVNQHPSQFTYLMLY